MPSTPVRDIELIEVGSLGKETLSNDAFTNLSHGISGTATIALTNVDRPLTATEGLAFVLILTGTVTADVAVIVPQESRVYIVDNRCTVPGAHSVTVRPPVGGGITVDSGGQRAVLYCDGSDVYPVASGTGGSGGGSGAPTEASYLVQSAHSLLTGERVVTNSPTISWDFATPGAARALIPPGAVSYTHLQNVTPTRLLGRFTGVAGDVQEITPGTGLTLDAGGVLSATATGQPLDATLTALAGLATGANLLPYFTGVDTVTTTTLSAFIRTLLDDGDAAMARSTLEAQASDATLTALAGVTASADTLPFFTGVDTASTTALTAFMRGLLDDPDLATAQATLGITGGGGGAPTDAVYIVAAAHTGLSAERVVTDTVTIDWDTSVANQLRADVNNNSITFAKMQTISAARLLGRGSSASGVPEQLTTSTALAISGTVLGLADDGVTYAKIQNISTTDRLLGRQSVGAGDVEEVVCTAAGRALLDDADAAAQRTTLALGTLAQQDASNVAITGGAATLSTVTLTTLLDVSNAAYIRALNRVGDNVGVLYSTMNAAGGTNRFGIAMEGDVPNRFYGPTQFGASPALITDPVNSRVGIGAGMYVPAYPLDVTGSARITGNIGAGGVAPVGNAAIAIRVVRASVNGLYIQPDADSGAAQPAVFLNASGSQIGSISTTASATAYNTSSDVRLKRNIHALRGGVEAIQRLRPVNFTWNSTDEADIGFLAHELMTVAPNAVSGLPDEVNPDGTIKPQQVDQSKLIPILTAGIKELLAQVEALQARVQGLEAQLGV